jgi:parallel beta-helix repeat protein
MHIKLIKLFYSFCGIFFLSFIFPSVCWAATYYAAPNGSGSTCTTFSPCSLNTGVGKLVNGGDTLILQDSSDTNQYKPSGVVNISVRGTASQPITIKAEHQGKATINCVNSGLGRYTGSCINITGDYIRLEGLEVINSYAVGIGINGGNNNTLSSLIVHENGENGILIISLINGEPDKYCANTNGAHDNIVEDSQIYNNTLMNENGESTIGWPTGISAARCPYRTIFRRNIVHDNWGEGLSAFNAHNTLIEDNIVYDNREENIYIDGAPGTTVRRNLVYTSGPNAVGYKRAPGIGFCDELAGANVNSTGVKIINNFVKGGNGAFYFFQQEGIGTKSFLMANNTFVGSDDGATLKFENANFSGSRIENNIFVAGSDGIASVANSSGITFSHNLWSTSGGISGIGDVIGDPMLAKTGSASAPTADWFELAYVSSMNKSPAIDKALVLSDVTEDYFGSVRGASPDIGAHEYVSSGGATPTVTPTPTPTVACLGADNTINADDLAAWVKSYTSINNVLKFAELVSHWGESCQR